MIAAGVLLLAAVVVVGIRLQSVRGPVTVDAVASTKIAQHGVTGGPVATEGSRAAVQLGNELPVMLGMAALALWAVFRRDASGAIVAILGPSAAIFLTEYVLKPGFDRTTTHGALSYPSGHVTAVVALATVALLLVYRYDGPWMALLWSPIALGAVAAIAFAVVALRWHYVTDSFGGVALGVGVVLLVAGAADSISGEVRRPFARGRLGT